MAWITKKNIFLEEKLRSGVFSGLVSGLGITTHTMAAGFDFYN